MTEDVATADKSIVGELNFGAKTSKRVTWEAWEFTVAGPHQIEVTNASWGAEKADHSYLVAIEDRDGVPVPTDCGCKADRFREDYDCKHKVALATVGGPVVLQAAITTPTPTGDAERTTPETLEDRLRADGGAVPEETGEDSPTLDAAEPEECDCANLLGEFPCWPCVRDGKRELPE